MSKTEAKAMKVFTLTGGTVLTTKNFLGQTVEWESRAARVRDDVQQMGEFAMEHYVVHGNTEFITRLYQAARGNNGVRLATLDAWFKACVNVRHVGKGDEYAYKKNGGRKASRAYLVNADKIEPWHEHDKAGLASSEYTLEKLLKDLLRTEKDDRGKADVSEEAIEAAEYLLKAWKKRALIAALLESEPSALQAANEAANDTANESQNEGDEFKEFDNLTQPATAVGAA